MPPSSEQAQENKRLHLQMIQQTIDRISNHLFLLKGWAVTLAAALVALAAQDANPVYFLIAYLPALMFWILDGYFLSQERRFRALYDKVRALPEDDVDFSMDTLRFADGHSWGAALWSRTLVIFYGSLIAAMLIVIVLVGD